MLQQSLAKSVKCVIRDNNNTSCNSINLTFQLDITYIVPNGKLQSSKQEVITHQNRDLKTLLEATEPVNKFSRWMQDAN